MNLSSRIFVAGHRGLVGSALTRRLLHSGYSNIIVKEKTELDLTEASAVRSFFQEFQPEYVFLAAAQVGGIKANIARPAEFIQTNLAIQNSVIHASHQMKAERLIFFGSNCAYPKECVQPMNEEFIGTGRLEQSSEPYAVAKIAGIRMCQAYNRQYGNRFISVIPSTVYGPNDNFDPDSAHVLSSLIARFHQAKEAHMDEAIVWGTGTPRREFIHSDDLADACIHLMNMNDDALQSIAESSDWILNAGSGTDHSIIELAFKIKEIVGFHGKLVFDRTKPDGATRRLLDSNRLTKTGWFSRTRLTDGLKHTFEWYQDALLKATDTNG